MFLIDRLLVGGLSFVLDKVARAAESELDSEESLRRRLLEAQMRLELGEIDDAEFGRVEAAVLGRLRELQEAERGATGALDSRSVAGVDIAVGGDED
jgi:hypothetical protein